ncbi:transmembrane protein [Cystoisospora suis]|uniref:Transmembrane protein n=1 Tax=Cystoisospora suis TaxID=483139 RepID=A0A2C6KZU8_9APIC|nr:transmembrane protein [Cystoisospora suis]
MEALRFTFPTLLFFAALASRISLHGHATTLDSRLGAGSENFADFAELSSTPESSFYLADAGGVFYEDDRDGASISRSKERSDSLHISSSGAPDAGVSLADLSPINGDDDGSAGQASPGVTTGGEIPAGAEKDDGAPLVRGGASSSLKVEGVKSNVSPDIVVSPSPNASINSARLTLPPAGGADTMTSEASDVISIGSDSGTQSTDVSSLSSELTGLLPAKGDAAAFPPSGEGDSTANFPGNPELFHFFHNGEADSMLNCVRVKKRARRERAVEHFCRRFARNTVLRRRCSDFGVEFLAELGNAVRGCEPHCFPELFESMKRTLRHPFFKPGDHEADLAAVQTFVKKTIANPWTPEYEEQGDLPSRTCASLQTAWSLAQDSRRLARTFDNPLEKAALNLVATRRTLYSAFMWPSPEPIELGLWAQVVDFSGCKRVRQGTPELPRKEKMGNKEIAEKAFAFGLARQYIPRRLECSVSSTEGTCKLLHNYLAVNRTLLEIGRVLGTPQAGLMVEDFAGEVRQRKEQVTDFELWNAQLTAEMTAVETFLLGLRGNKRLVRLLASLAKVKVIAKLIGGAVSLLKSWIYPFEKEVISSSRVRPDIAPVVLAMQNASVFFLGGLGTCVVGNTGMGNIMEVVAMKITKAFNEDGSASSFLQLLPAEPQPAAEEDESSEQTSDLVPYTTTAVRTPGTLNNGSVDTAGSSTNVFLQMRSKFWNRGPGKSAHPWFESRWRMRALAIAGAVLSFAFIGTMFIPLIHPVFFAVLSVGLLGFFLYVAFSTALLMRHALLKAVEQGVMGLDMKEAEVREKERIEREAVTALEKQMMKRRKKRRKAVKGKDSKEAASRTSVKKPSPPSSRPPAVDDAMPGYASDDDALGS